MRPSRKPRARWFPQRGNRAKIPAGHPRGRRKPAGHGIVQGVPWPRAQHRCVAAAPGHGHCAPCGDARTLLTTRGIPFEERTVKSNEEVEALQRLSSQTSLPLLTIGSQQLKGYSDTAWSQYLDAAGYPKSNSLPAGYRNAPARPLVAQQAAPAPRAAAAPAAQPAPPAPAPSDPGAGNPAGIKF
jgi:glutaredoxin